MSRRWILFALLMTGCSNGALYAHSSGSSTPPPSPAAFSAEPLDWESASHPERAQWSRTVFAEIETHFDDLNSARDVATFCPAYADLSRAQRLNVWGQIFAALAYYESGWNPASHSVDVGAASDPDTWSIGLLQMSVVDQASYQLAMGLDFAALLTVAGNLKLGVAIMALQIRKYGLISLPVGTSGLYWATLHPGGKYDQTQAIAARVQHLSFCR